MISARDSVKKFAPVDAIYKIYKPVIMRHPWFNIHNAIIIFPSCDNYIFHSCDNYISKTLVLFTYSNNQVYIILIILILLYMENTDKYY